MSRLARTFAVAVVISSTAAVTSESLEYPDLVRRLWDLDHVAILPPAGERCAQWSSWDRASRYDAGADRYIDWNANGDGTGFLRQENGRLVLAEMSGPGCIWRIWSAQPQSGAVRLILDGKVVVDMPFTNFFTGQHAPFDFPNLAYTAARGYNLYLPIPYRRSCVVLAETNWGRFYHFTYTTFAPGTEVPTFEAPLPAVWRDALRDADRRLGTALEAVPPPPPEAIHGETADLALPGRALRLAHIRTARRIVHFEMTIAARDREDQIAAHRELVLRMRWDGETQPAVECPVGDFFGSAPGINPFRTWPTAMENERLVSRWPMPFASEAIIEVANEGGEPRPVRMRLAHVAETRAPDIFGRFHARWHRGLGPVRPDRHPDWPFLIVGGRGRFCGLMLHVWNPIGGRYEPAKPGHWWWGEGDEKFFVDGEPFPSTFGTGTEDYFGYAWGCPEKFQRPFHAQTMSEDNAGHQSLVRWHVADNVPFQSRFEGCLEKYFPDERPTLYTAAVFWYMAPGGRHGIGLPPVHERHGWVRPPPEAGGFRLAAIPPGSVRTQNMSQFTSGSWDQNDQLWWTGGRPGDRIELFIRPPKAGRHRLRLILTRARDYGIVRFDLDDRPCGEPVDLYHPTVAPLGPVDLGTHEFSAEDHRLGVTIVGANPAAMPAYMFGLDQVLFEPAEPEAR